MPEKLVAGGAGIIATVKKPPSLRPAPILPKVLPSVLSVALLCASGVPVWSQSQAQHPGPAPASALPGAAATPSNLPALGDSASDEFDVSAERRLGEQIMRDIRRDPDYLDDPVLLDDLQSLWQPLLAAARARGEIGSDTDTRFAWEAFLVRDRSVNAFALPGGFVGVHLGLIGMTAARDELASVLAHELAHVTQRHIARSIGSQRRQSAVGMAAMILGVLAAAKSRSADGANAAIAGSQALVTQGQLNFSRDMEREADRMGFGLLRESGFAPSGMAAMFEKLDHASRLNDSGAYPYLRSHPLTTDRIGEARARLGTGAIVWPTSEAQHAMMQARARVLMDPRATALRRWQVAPESRASASEQISSAYADALASTLLRDWPRADLALQRLQNLVGPQGGRVGAKEGLKGEAKGDGKFDAKGARGPMTPGQRGYALLAAQSYAARGENARAIDVLQGLSVNERPVLLLLAQIAADANVPSESLQRSTDALQTWTTQHPTDAGAWLALSRNWQVQGQGLRALRAEAESRWALGDLTGAVDRLRAAQRMAREAGRSGAALDFIEASVIDVRLREAERLRRQQALEKPEL